jgi:hypothetical protein
MIKDDIANVSFRYRKRFPQPLGFAEKPAAREPPPGKKPRCWVPDINVLYRSQLGLATERGSGRT